MAVITLGNCPNTDILCSNKSGTKFVHIQVKTFVPGNKTSSVGKKAENLYTDKFFWILAGIPNPGSQRSFVYYVIPAQIISKEVAELYQLWLSRPGRKDQKRNDTTFRKVDLPPHCVGKKWDITCYENRWDLIEVALK